MDVAGLAAAADALLVMSRTSARETGSRGQAQWTLHALAKTAGEELWSVTLPGQPAISPPVIRADGTVLVAMQDGSVLGIGTGRDIASPRMIALE
jgi:outer membrane protein assembly factor BamB